MNHLRKFFSPYPVVLWIAAIVGLVLRLALTWQPLPTLIARFNADDAYYYLTIARHVAEGQGATFDGIALTNGFHPLYLALIVQLFWLSPRDAELTVHVALSILVMLNVVTAFVLYSLLNKVASSAAGVVTAIAWLFNPFVVLISLEGVESAVYLFCIALTIELYVNYRITDHKQSNANLAQAGVAMGLAILARSEAILLLSAIIVDMVARCWATRPRLSNWIRAVVPEGILFLGACLLMLIPWILWNIATFHTITQVSGAAIFYRTHTAVQALSEPIQQWAIFVFQMFILVVVLIYPIYLLGLPVLLAVIRQRSRHMITTQRERWARSIKALSFIAFYAVLVFVFYVGFLWHLQLWYFSAIVLATTIGTGVLFAILTSSMRQATPRSDQNVAWVFATINVLACGFIGVWWQFNQIALYPAQRDGYQIAQWLARNTEPNARVGAWNSGIIGYFADRTVVNLDGVVNSRLYTDVTARHATFSLRDIWGNIQADQLEYVTDYEDVFPATIESEWAGKLQLAYEFPSIRDNRNQVRIYRVIHETAH